MLKEYFKYQPVCCQILNNAIKSQQISHAYLFETNGYEKAMDLIINFVKMLFSTDDPNQNELIFSKIDKNIFSELEIIECDGLFIKKEQLDNLQINFKNKSLESNKKIYIINGAEKLNKSSANSILKFLEEPEENIIAILVTNNKYNVLETIKSRCQIISLKGKPENQENNILLSFLFKDKQLTEYFPGNIEIENFIKHNINFILHFEKKGIDTILSTHQLWHAFVKNKLLALLSFDIMILFYKDVFNYQITKKTENFKDYEEKIKTISELNNPNSIINKINIIIKNKKVINSNANLPLLIDKLIMELEEHNND